jgi:hypothetical protein
MSNGDAKLGILIIGDPEPLVRLAEVGQLDVLLGYRQVVIVDELAFEACSLFAAAKPLADPDRLQRWINEQVTAGRVSSPTTWVGEAAVQARNAGLLIAVGHRTGAVAVVDYLNTRREAKDPAHLTLLIDDCPGFARWRATDSSIESVDTRSMLMDLGYPVD